MSDIDWMRVDAAAQRSMDQDHMATAIENGLSRGTDLFLRRLAVSWILAAVLVVALTMASFIARGAVQSAPGDTGTAGRVVLAPASTSLPLQSRGLAISGNIQAAATNLASFSITPKQLEEIHRVCFDAVEIPSTGPDACGHALRRVIAKRRIVSNGPKQPCPPSGRICMKLQQIPGSPHPTVRYYWVLADQRPTGLCNADPARVCIRIGIMSATLQSVLKYLQPASLSSPTTGSPTPTTTTAGDMPTTTTTSGTATTPTSGDTATTSEGPTATSTPVH